MTITSDITTPAGYDDTPEALAVFRQALSDGLGYNEAVEEAWPEGKSLAEGERFYTANTLKGEITRRKNNKSRDKHVPAKNWALAKLSKADVTAILAGGKVTVEAISSGRTQTVCLKQS